MWWMTIIKFDNVNPKETSLIKSFLGCLLRSLVLFPSKMIWMSPVPREQ